MDTTAAPEERLLSVGSTAARLGVAAATLRSWERRYGLTPAGRSSGGHRRYTAADLERLDEMQRLVATGITPARAAHAVLSGSPPVRNGPPPAGSPEQMRRRAPASRPGDAQLRADRSRPRGGPGGQVLAVPGGSPAVRGLARAASRLDADAVAGLVGDLLAVRGAIATWDDVLRPVLVAAGLRWARTGEGIDIEHVLSEATTDALRAYRACQLHPFPGRPVLIACAPDDLHALPLHVLAAALSERRVPVRVLGARVPENVLASASRRTGAAAAFIWRQLAADHGIDVAALPKTRPPLVVVVGGPGWDGVELAPSVRRVPDLSTAVAVLEAARR